MTRWNVLSLLLALSTAVISGCSTKYIVPADEIALKQDQKYLEVVFPSKITGVILPTKDTTDNLLEKVETAHPNPKDSTSERIIFDENCGALDSEGYSVTGVTSEKDTVKINLQDVFFVEFSNTDLPRLFMTPDSILQVCQAAKFKPEKAFSRAEIPYWDVVIFDKRGGQYDPSTDMIHGKANSGTEINIALNEVHYARYRKLDIFKSMRVGLVAVGLAYFAQGVADIFDL